MKAFIVFFLSLQISLIYCETVIRYPNINGLGKESFSYAVLELALINSKEEFRIDMHEYSVNDESTRLMLKQGKIDIADFGISKEFEEDFRTIYIPIDYGITGWRLFVIKKETKKEFSNIKNIEDLKYYRAGQGVGWSDIKILKSSNLEVVTAPHLDQLFAMLDKDRFDYIPLEAHLVHWLLEGRNTKYPSLYIDDNLLLIYPFGRFFFVHPDNRELHDIIKKGLIESYNNGSFLKLFKTHKTTKDLFIKGRLSERIRIFIPNPLQSSEFKKIPKKYFLNPNSFNEEN